MPRACKHAPYDMSRRRKNRRPPESRPPPREDILPAQRRAAFESLAVCGFLVLAVFLVFGRTLGNGFINYDDNIYVYENPHVVRGLTAEGIALGLHQPAMQQLASG